MMLNIAIVILCLGPASASHRLLRGLTADPKSVKRKDRIAKPDTCEIKQNVKFMSPYREDEIVWETFFADQLKCGGTVIETGGFDSNTYASSYFFEYAAGWKAILVEALPSNFAKAVANRPDATIVFGAMCLGETTTLRINDVQGADSGEIRLADDDKDGGKTRNEMQKNGEELAEDFVEVPCIMVTDIMRDHQVDLVDVFFLGCAEAFDVLQTIDWGKVRIDIFVVDLDGSNPLRDEAIRAVLRSRGYVSPFAMENACRSKQENCNGSELFVLQEVWARTAKNHAPLASQRDNASAGQHDAITTLDFESSPSEIRQSVDEESDEPISIDQGTKTRVDLASPSSKARGAIIEQSPADEESITTVIDLLELPSKSKSRLAKQKALVDQDMTAVSSPILKGRSALVVEEQDVLVDEDAMVLVTSPLSSNVRNVLVEEEQQVEIDQDTPTASKLTKSKRALGRQEDLQQQVSVEQFPTLRNTDIVPSASSRSSKHTMEDGQQPMEQIAVDEDAAFQTIDGVERSSPFRLEENRKALISQQQENVEVVIEQETIDADPNLSSPFLAKVNRSDRNVDKQQHHQQVLTDQDTISTKRIDFPVSSSVAQSRGDKLAAEEEEQQRGNDPDNQLQQNQQIVMDHDSIISTKPIDRQTMSSSSVTKGKGNVLAVVDEEEEQHQSHDPVNQRSTSKKTSKHNARVPSSTHLSIDSTRSGLVV